MDEYKVNVEANKCLRCGHVWLGRGKYTPVFCSKCKSPYWNRQNQAALADFVPADKLDIEATKNIHKCLRCGHTWEAKKPGRPNACAKCRNTYWDKPRGV